MKSLSRRPETAEDRRRRWQQTPAGRLIQLRIDFMTIWEQEFNQLYSTRRMMGELGLLNEAAVRSGFLDWFSQQWAKAGDRYSSRSLVSFQFRNGHELCVSLSHLAPVTVEVDGCHSIDPEYKAGLERAWLHCTSVR